MFSDKVKKLCYENKWFTLGNDEQYNRMLECCDDPLFTEDDITVMIWICSENVMYSDIYQKLMEA